MHTRAKLEKEPTEIELSRFFGYFTIDDNDCWNWLAYKDEKGYGQFHSGGINWRAHRFSYLLVHGKTTQETLDHTCNNTSCVNPDHLREMSASMNRLLAHGGDINTFPCGHSRAESWSGGKGKGRRCKPCTWATIKKRQRRERATAYENNLL